MLLSALGWRQSLAVLGILIGAVVLLLARLIRERPGPGMTEPSATNAACEGTGQTDGAVKPLTLGQVVRKPLFWIIVISSGSAFGIQQATIVSMIPFAQGEGYSVPQAATLLSTMGAMSISGKLVLAWLGDRVARTTILSVLFALLALASGGLSQAHSYPALLACSAMFGLAMGASTPAYLTLLADRFGAASFGIVSGSGSFISTLIGAGLLRYGGEVYDRTGGYQIMFLSFLVLAGTATVLIAMCHIVGLEAGKRP
ncbi:MAG: MFS transporter [Oxalobacteraceae bacterium]|nr:MAG: MFS transporter [Oxalobacteraceae bacterium]